MLASMHSQMDGGVSLSQSGESSALSQDQLAELNAFYGLDQPVTTAYINWLTKLVTLDLGESTRYYEPVTEMIAERLPVSLFYGAMTFVISYLISFHLAITKHLNMALGLIPALLF